MQLHDLLLFLHILGAAGWIGLATFGYFFLGRSAQVGGEARGNSMEFFVERVREYGVVVIPLLVLSGVALVLVEDRWSWSDTFIWVGIGVVVATGVWEGAYARRRDQALVEAVKRDAPDRLVQRRRWIQTYWVEVALILVALWAMITKLA